MVEFAVSEKREFKPFITVGDDKLKRLFAEVAVGQDPATHYPYLRLINGIKIIGLVNLLPPVSSAYDLSGR